MKTRLSLAVIGVLTAAIAAATGAPAATRGATTKHPTLKRLPLEGVTRLPAGAAARSGDVRVIVRVRTRPVAALRASAIAKGRQLRPWQISTRRTVVRRSSLAARRGVLRVGGRVHRVFTDVLNGFSATVPARSLPQLRRLPGVISVTPARTIHRANQASNTFTGVATEWSASGFTGKNVTVAVIDTGVDYTHADFGGPGTVAAFNANDGSTLSDGGFPTAKVIGGFDFVGDEFDPDSADPAIATPVEDPDPLDCDGHGTHVAGTAAGAGVTADGATYAGPYTADALQNTQWKVAPGSAPNAKILAYRVFGCAGATPSDIVVAAIDRAVQDGADVINMSLGSTFGLKDSIDAIASNNAVRSGTTVVASAGNEGPNAYVVGAPSVGDAVLSVAAMDAEFAKLQTLQVGDGTTNVIGQNSNEATVPQGGISGMLAVTRDGAGAVGLGCSAAEFGNVTGKIAVVARGTCARVDKAAFGQAAGALAVVMINNEPDTLPPFEGIIPGVTIPFVGVLQSDEAALVSLDGKPVTLGFGPEVDNPGYAKNAGFTSNGPRRGDSALKTDIVAPGVSILSAASGTGNDSRRESGTSMSGPHTAGIAALVREAHPRWQARWIKAAIMATADPTKVLDYSPTRSGSGLVQADRAVSPTAIAVGANGRANLSFGYAQLTGGYDGRQRIDVRNVSGRSVTLDLAAAFAGDGLGATANVTPAVLRLRPREVRTISLRLRLSAAAAAALPGAPADFSVTTIGGAVTGTPRGGGNPIRIPFLLVPRSTSDVRATRTAGSRASGSVTIHLANAGSHAGTADVYQLGLTDPRDFGGGELDLRTIGAQSFPGDAIGAAASDRLIVFAVGVHGRWSAASANEFDVPLDTNGDGTPDFLIAGADFGAITTGSADGQLGSFIIDLRGDPTIVNAYVGSAPADGSTLFLPFLASDVGLTAAAPGFEYSAESLDLAEGATGSDPIAGTAYFDAYDPQVQTGDFAELAAGASSDLVAAVRAAKASDRAPAAGWLVVSVDDLNGGSQQDLVRLR